MQRSFWNMVVEANERNKVNGKENNEEALNIGETSNIININYRKEMAMGHVLCYNKELNLSII